MSLQQEIIQHNEKVWVVCLHNDSLSGSLSPVPGVIDWYHNQIVLKSVLNKKISLEFGDRTLISGSPLLPCSHLVIFGLGDTKELNSAKAKKTLQELGTILTDLQEPSAWIVVTKDAPSHFVDDLKKSRTSVESLDLSSITAG